MSSTILSRRGALFGCCSKARGPPLPFTWYSGSLTTTFHAVYRARTIDSSSRRRVSSQVKQKFPGAPESHYASTLKNLNILSDAKVVVVGRTDKLEAIEKTGTNVVGFVDETSQDLTRSIQNVLKDALPWVLFISTQKALPVLEALKCATQVQIPLVVCATSQFEEGEMKELRGILDQSAMTRLLGPGSSVFAAPHSGLAVWDKPLDAVKPGTIGIVGSDYKSIEEAVEATKKYGHSVIFDLGTNPRAGTRPWEAAEWMFSDDGTEILLVMANGNSEMEGEVAKAYKEYAERTPDNQRRKRMIGIIQGDGRKQWEEAGILVASKMSEAIGLISKETEKISEKREEVAEVVDREPAQVSVTDI
ncbi:hypothetical protein QFC22_001321 [Naganishia vaughanmartiniae]|uniref:Uncharacterized protein n=1 Tax=Naganishia vaughanmartiniae TaxID=1424756 RepID=A0ACC2XGH4_9TREE|nr:hypothetical protein QFC22_001321 [Naganishia vaughanmartiniae]